MHTLKAGFARLEITPPLGLAMEGYFYERRAEGILDPLYATALAVNDGKNTAVIFSVDLIGIKQVTLDKCRKIISERAMIPYEAVFIACTHTHTGPVMNDRLFNSDPTYNDIFYRRMADAATLAISDLQPATLSIGRGKATDISFVRRFRMKNGEVHTNPGIGNPDILKPIGTPDEDVQLVKISRGDAPEILIVNFQVHPDVIGGCSYSADYPKFVRDSLESALSGTKCIYFNGAQGDTNHFNVNTTPDKANKGYEHSKHMGRTIAGAVLQVYGKTKPISNRGVRFIQKSVLVPTNRATNENQLIEAEHIIELHKSGREDEVPAIGMKRSAVIARAYRLKRLQNEPENYNLYLTAVRFGGVVISGIPGEPFTEIGRSIKKNTPFDMSLVCCCANGYEGYYPMKSAYDEGGYEAATSNFKTGVAEILVENSVKIQEEIFD